jgi:hypothetical protein
MAQSSQNQETRGHLQRAAGDIAAARARGAATGLSPTSAGELAAIEARHGDLHRRLKDLEAQGTPEHHIAGALAADLDGLRQSIDSWIARQDAKAAHR